MHSNDTAYTDAALRVIYAADPGLCLRMLRTPWFVYVLDPAQELPFQFWADMHFDQWHAGKYLSNAIGITIDKTNRTYLVLPAIAELAREENITVPQAAATIMVHEFAHTLAEGVADERTAYAVQRAFDAKTGHGLHISSRAQEDRQIAVSGNEYSRFS
jgi:hypothetical protein